MNQSGILKNKKIMDELNVPNSDNISKRSDVLKGTGIINETKFHEGSDDDYILMSENRQLLIDDFISDNNGITDERLASGDVQGNVQKAQVLDVPGIHDKIMQDYSVSAHQTLGKQSEERGDMKRSRLRELYEAIAEKIFFLCAMISILCVAAIIVFVFSRGIKPFVGSGAYNFLDFISQSKWDPSNELYGVFYMIAGSVLATLGAVAFGVPIGLLTAVFIAETAPKRLVRIIKPAIELLAGIPSVIYGAFGLGIIVPLVNKISPRAYGESLFAVIIVLTIMVLPTIINLSEAALRAVPKSYREASYGMGATEIQTIFRVVIPAAKSGILSAAVLGIGRAIGETMAVMMIAGNPIGGIPLSIWDKIRPLTTNISMEMGYASGQHQDMLFATGVVLFVFIMLVNFTLIRITGRERKRG